tara:strand:- start:266 stop:703 length:438 start_codon:yes stop_codon:yes gene_type:complete
MEPSICTIEDVLNILNEREDVTVLSSEDDILIIEKDGVNVVIVMTDEEIPRLRFQADVARLDDFEDDPEIMAALLFAIADLNDQIDPVAAGIDSNDPDNIMIKGITSLRVIDLCREEVEQELEGLVATLPSIAHSLKVAVAVPVD